MYTVGSRYICDWRENVYKPVSFDESLWARISEAVKERDELRCQACRKIKLKKYLTVHHIIPRASGGTDDPDNLITLCFKCHDYIEEQGERNINRIRNSTIGIDWDAEEQQIVEEHNEFMDTLDDERPDWHNFVYGCKHHRKKRHK